MDSLAATVDRLREEQQKARAEQARESQGLKDHIDQRVGALTAAVANTTRDLAVLTATSAQWQLEHNKTHQAQATQYQQDREAHQDEHDRERESLTRKSWAADILAAIAAAVVGIFVNPGGGP